MGASPLDLQSPVPAPNLTSDLLVILDRARAMQRRGWHHALQTQLRGRKLALLTAREIDAESRFQEVAEALGANVIRVPSRLTTQQTVADIQRMARVLGRFYDAVNCEGMESDLVRLLQASSQAPVFDDLCSERHSVTRLAEFLDPGCDIEENRRWAAMSALMSALD